MAIIRSFPLVRHLRSEPSRYLLHYRSGRLKRRGRGLSFWFAPLSSTLAELPCDDRDLSFLFHGRSSDYQDVTVQGVISYRVADPDALAERIDFSIDPADGGYLENPLEQLADTLTKRAQQHAHEYLVAHPVRELLAGGLEPIRRRIEEALYEGEGLEEMGIEVLSVSVSDLSPSRDLSQALEAPALESIHEQADEATFRRRAQAVEKERAIAEAELQNNIELAAREELLIAQRGQNDRRRAEEEALSQRISTESGAECSRLDSTARAEGIRVVEEARVGGERERMEIYEKLPSHVMLGLAAKEFAGKLQKIEHLNVSPDMLTSWLGDLFEAGVARLSPSAKGGKA